MQTHISLWYHEQLLFTASKLTGREAVEAVDDVQLRQVRSHRLHDRVQRVLSVGAARVRRDG